MQLLAICYHTVLWKGYMITNAWFVLHNEIQFRLLDYCTFLNIEQYTYIT